MTEILDIVNEQDEVIDLGVVSANFTQGSYISNAMRGFLHINSLEV